MRAIKGIVVLSLILLFLRHWLIPPVADPFPRDELRQLLSRELPSIFNIPKEKLEVFDISSMPAKKLDSPPSKDSSTNEFKLMTPANRVDELAMVVARSTLDEIHGVGKILSLINETSKEKNVGLRLIARTRSSIEGLQLARIHEKNLTLSPYIEKNIHFWLRDYVVPLYGLNGKRAFIETKGEQIELGIPEKLAEIFGGSSIRPENVDARQSGNCGGNILALPDGRLIVGSTMTNRMESYLKEQGNPSAIIRVDTSWYYFGHIDTTVAVIPTPNGSSGFVLAIADARLGKELIDNIEGQNIKGELIGLLERLFIYRKIHPESFGKEDAVLAMKMFEDVGQAYRVLKGFQSDRGYAVINANERAAKALDELAAKLAAKVGVPVVRLPAFYGEGPLGLVADLLPAMANMVVIGEDLIIPDPLLPTFVEHAKHVLTAVGCRVHFLPSATFHNLRGQLHCATIEIRSPHEYIHDRYAPNVSPEE